VIPFFDIKFTKEMEEVALQALYNENFIMGESVFKFEEEFARYIGTKYAVSVSSGNSALHLSLLALGIKNGSKVLTSTNSFIASANCILMVGARPELCDINLEDGNIDLSKCEYGVDAVIPVHIYGNPCDYESVIEYSQRYNIPIIEDACQAHGAIYDDKKAGSLGDVGCFSFYSTKNMTVAGDGGMVTTNNEDVANTIRSLRDNGRKSKVEHDKLGFTMRLNTVSAAIGRVQLKHLDEFNKRRKEILRIYQQKLGKELFLGENPKGKAVYHQIVIKHKNRDKIMKHLSDNKIGTAIHYPIPIHKQPLYSKYGFVLPNAEKFVKEILSLPSYPLLKDEEVALISEKIMEAI